MYYVKVGFTYYDVDYVCDYTYVFFMALLSIYIWEYGTSYVHYTSKLEKGVMGGVVMVIC